MLPDGVPATGPIMGRPPIVSSARRAKESRGLLSGRLEERCKRALVDPQLVCQVAHCHQEAEVAGHLVRIDRVNPLGPRRIGVETG